MSRDFDKILEFSKNYIESKVFEALIREWDSIVKSEEEELENGNIFLKINFHNSAKNKLSNQYYQNFYLISGNDSDFFDWNKFFFENNSFDDFINIIFWLMNDPEANDKKHPNFLAFQEVINNKKSLIYTNVKTKLEYLYYRLNRQELVYIYLMSDHEDFGGWSLSGYRFDSLSQFYNFLKCEYIFDLDMFINLLILIGHLHDDKCSNDIINHINNFGTV